VRFGSSGNLTLESRQVQLDWYQDGYAEVIPAKREGQVNYLGLREQQSEFSNGCVRDQVDSASLATSYLASARPMSTGSR